MSTNRDGFTAGLRAIACFLDDHPDVPLPYLGRGAEGSSLPGMPIFLVDQSTARAELAAVTRAMGTATKAPVTYHNGDERFQVWREFAGIVLYAQADRAEVCTRVVTGTEDREVEEEVKPAVTRKVTKKVEIVRWECSPILATPAAGLADAVIEADPDGVADAVTAGLAGQRCRDCGATQDQAPLHELIIGGERGERRIEVQCQDHTACAARRTETAKAGG